MATMPIRATRVPSAIMNQPNGAIDPKLLGRVDRDGYLWQMAELPARGMRAMHAAIKADLGIKLDSTGRGRDLRGQWDIFCGTRARYRPCPLAEYNVDKAKNKELTKLWPAKDRHAVEALLNVSIEESDYWTKINVGTVTSPRYPATAAVPGTSPHGMWCADDLSLPDGPDLGTDDDPLTVAVIQWLFENEMKYGFAHSTLSESWHVQWFVGDIVPLAVLTYELGLPAPKPPPQGAHDMARFFKVPGDPAAFAVTGTTCNWIRNMDHLATAISAQTIEPTPIEVPRSTFAAFTLIGALPPGWTAGEFAGVVS